MVRWSSQRLFVEAGADVAATQKSKQTAVARAFRMKSTTSHSPDGARNTRPGPRHDYALSGSILSKTGVDCYMLTRWRRSPVTDLATEPLETIAPQEVYPG